MLNISNNNRIGETIEKYSTFKTLSDRPHYKVLNKIIGGVSLFGLLILGIQLNAQSSLNLNLASLLAQNHLKVKPSV